MLSDFQKYTASPEFQELLQRYEKSREEDTECYIDLNDIIDIAEYYHSIEAFDEAEAAADYCHRMYPDNDSPLLFKARMALIDYGDYEKAEKIYSALPQKDDSVEEAYVYAEILVCRNKVEEAEAFLDRKYEDLKRQYEESVDTSGRVDSYDDEFEEEMEDFRDALEHFPLDIAMMYSDHGLPDYANLIDDAIQSAEFAQAISVDDPQPNMFLGALHLEKNNTAKGVEEFLKTIEKSGYDLAVMIRVGLAFYELGYKDAALNMMEMIKKPFEEADLMSECPPIVQEIIDKCKASE